MNVKSQIGNQLREICDMREENQFFSSLFCSVHKSLTQLLTQLTWTILEDETLSLSFTLSSHPHAPDLNRL